MYIRVHDDNYTAIQPGEKISPLIDSDGNLVAAYQTKDDRGYNLSVSRES